MDKPIPEAVGELRELIDRYWDLAYAEGRDGRDCDTKSSDAQGCRRQIEKRLRILTAAQQQEQAKDCHCATCTCRPGMTPAVRFDTTPADKEGAVRDHLLALGWTPPGAQQPAAVDEAAERLAEAVKGEPGWSSLNPQARIGKARRYLALATQHQEPPHDRRD